MKTKIVYIVVSDENDSYLEQALVSVWSAQVKTPDAHVSLIVDQHTNQTLTGRRALILEYISEKIVVDVPEQYSKMQRSRFLKTTLRNHIDGNYLYVDSDTIICQSLSDVDALDMDIGAVLDLHVCLPKSICRKRIIENLSHIGMKRPDIDDRYFNSGVLFVRDTDIAYTLYDEWNRAWKHSISVGISTDQSSLAKADHICGNVIQELPGIWNAQITRDGIYALNDAYVFHYFGLHHQIPKLTGDVPSCIVECVRYVQDSFASRQFYIDEDTELLTSNVATIYRYHKPFFAILEWVSRLLVQKHI